jgi:hypothetical protein
MARIRTILRFQWRAYWRRFHTAGSFRTNNVGALILVGGLGLMRYVLQLPLAANQLAKGETAKYEVLLLIAFFAWMVPVMGESRRSISTRDLLHFPLSATDLFLIRIGSVFCSPVVWITAAVSLALSYPAAMARYPLTGIAALLTLLFCGFFASLAITHVLQSALARKVLFVVLLAVSVVGGLLWLSGRRVELLTKVKALLPHRLAATAAVSTTPVRSLAILIALTALFAALARWTFVLTLEPSPNQRSYRFALVPWPQLPGKFGGLLKKDLRYTSRLLDLYLALPIVVLFNIYLAVNFAPASTGLFIAIGVLFWPCSSIAFNCFGLDSPLGLDRYTLFPLSEKEKLFSKNLAFWIVMLGLFCTILPFAIWFLEPSASVIGLLEFVAVGLAYAAIGNWLSVKQPFKMQFYRFASGGSVVDAIMGLIFASIPVALTILLGWKIGIVILIYLALYLFFLARAARILNDQREEIRRAVS